MKEKNCDERQGTTCKNLETADSFVFYRSFRENIRPLTRDQQLDILLALFDRCLDGVKTPIGPLADALVNQMACSVKSAKDRHAEAHEKGKQGGRPSIGIPPEEWQSYYNDHTGAETAEHFGISESTLKRWIRTTNYKKVQVQKGQNLNVNDNVNVNVNDNDIIIRNNSVPDGEPSGASVCPEYTLNDDEILWGKPYTFDGVRWVITVMKPNGEKVARYVN